MEIRQLRYFIAVAEEKNFGLAARKLHVSQPPITRQIQQLEEELGVLLLRRTSKGTDLTEAGKVFLEEARAVLTHLERATERSKAAQRGELGEIEIGYFGSVSYRVVPHILEVFKRENPDVSLSLRRLSKSDQVSALKQGVLHVGFGRYYTPEPGLVIEEVIKEGVSLCIPQALAMDIHEDNWRDAFSSMPLILFPSSGRPNFADETIALLKRENAIAKVSFVAEDSRAALMQVAISAGVCIVPSSIVGMNWHGVRFFKPKSLEAECPVSIIYRRSDTSPLLRRFVNALREFKLYPDLPDFE